MMIPIIKFLKLFFFSILGILLGYSLFALLGSLIPIHRKFVAPIGFILPCKNEVFDWAKVINPENFDLPLDETSILAFGWGDKAIYLDIVEWNELTVKMGLETLFLPTPTIMQVTAYQQLPTDKLTIKKTRISNSQYQQLCQFILESFVVDATQTIQLIPEAGYTPNDNFYQALGKYHAFYTCNTWVNQALRKIGVRTALWTSLDKGIFYQFEKIA